MKKSTLVFLLVAGLGLGALIGLSLVGEAERITQPAADVPAPVAAAGVPVVRYLDAADIVVQQDEFGEPLPTASGENFIARDGDIRADTMTIELAADEAVEYKAMMKQGDALSFRWSTDGGQLYYDFHGHDESFGPEFFTRYDEGEGTARSGSIVAAYDGQHGWYWLNLEARPLTITLDIAGFYDDVIRIDPGSY